jgi:hypothetical protein
MPTDPPKLCINCANAFRLPESPRYLRCSKSGAAQTDDASLAGEMRKGTCGPAATLWEARNGQA